MVPSNNYNNIVEWKKGVPCSRMHLFCNVILEFLRKHEWWLEKKNNRIYNIAIADSLSVVDFPINLRQTK